MLNNIKKLGAKSKTMVLRRLIQIGMLAVLGQWSFYGIVRCPFPVPYVGCSNCPVITCQGSIAALFWGTWLLIPLSVLLFGRMFCGWLCPGGLVQQLSGKVAFFKVRAKNTFNSLAPFGKYFALVLALCLWFVLNNPRWMIPIRVGEFLNSIILSFEHAQGWWLVRTFSVLGFLVFGFALANVWCRYACPTGGLLEALKRFSWLKIYMTDACTDCDACRAICEMGTRPREANCTNCGDCLTACPEKAIVIGRKR